MAKKKCKPSEIYRRMCDVYRKTCFSQKLFRNGLNMGLPLRVWVKKKVNWVERHWVSGKEKVPDTDVSKEGHADSLIDHEKTHHLISLKKEQL